MSDGVSARLEFEWYVRGMEAGGLPAKSAESLRQFARNIARETSALTHEPHPLRNDAGGDLICTDCYLGHDVSVHTYASKIRIGA